MNKKVILFGLMAMLLTVGSQGQYHWSQFTPSDTTVDWVCDTHYLWPQIISPCPEVQIKQKHDHTAQKKYRDRGWDTAIVCGQSFIELSCTPYIPVERFNGRYTVDEIPYDPADPTFHYEINLPNDDDDYFCAVQNLPTANASNGYHAFPFYFFGEKKTAFVAGGNGIISFNTSAANQLCAYGIYYPLPWPGTGDFGSNGGNGIGARDRHRNAIYGVFQDTDPSCISNDAPNYYGIWYGIKDQYPCRKIIASYNNIPWFSCNSTNPKQKYQIVCYEGSNIIEVHIAKRSDYPTGSPWCHNGVIGIQNATGTVQRTGTSGTSTQWVIDSSYAAYYPAAYATTGGNVGTATLEEVAYRFTPQGLTPSKSYCWYRLVEHEDGTITNDTLTEDNDGYHSYMESMQQDDPQYDDDNPAPCPTMTKAVIRNIDTTTRIVFSLRFKNANNDEYLLNDTITIGMDNDKTIDMHGHDKPDTVHVYDICASETGKIHLDFPALNDTTYTSWRVTRVSMGDTIELARDEVIEIDTISVIDTLDIKCIPITLKQQLPETGWHDNKIDSLLLQVTMGFNNSCDSFAVLLVRIFPEFDTTETVNSCLGQTYYWPLLNRTFHDHESGLYTCDTTSAPGCDSIVHLDLRFNDVRVIPVPVELCTPYTWAVEDGGNGRTYYETNTTTRSTDTVHIINEWNCEDIKELHFTYHPLTAKIHSSIDHFDYDHLEVELLDISDGNDNRRWIMPDQQEEHGIQVFYSIPIEKDSAKFTLFVTSPYGGCIDSTTLTMPFNKETVYLPNAFMPESAMDNNVFGSVSRNTLSEEMYIYNRRGELVYSCETVDCTWDGKDLNGNLCEQGAYVYVIKYINKFEPERTRVLKGTVTLIR